MIDDSKVKNYFNYVESFFSNKGIEKQTISPYQAQMFSGKTPKMWDNQKYPAACRRHKLLFKIYNVIPQYCFECYKIEITPNTVLDLFKLSMIFKMSDFEYTRKCFLRPKKDIPTHYSGVLYFQSLDDANKFEKEIKSILSSEISSDISLFVKRGCSEFGKAYPDYKDFEETYESLCLKNKNWRDIEKDFDDNKIADNLEPVTTEYYPHGTFTVSDYYVMHTWLSYARTIGDNSYRKITDSNIEVIPNALDKVSQIRGVTYNRNDMENNPKHAGVIAQEVEKVLPEVVQTNDDGLKTVAYGNMVGLLVEAIKELQAEIDELKGSK